MAAYNLVPTVLRLFSQRVGARRDSGGLEKKFKLSLMGCSVTACIAFYKIPAADQPLTKEPEDSGFEIGRPGTKK